MTMVTWDDAFSKADQYDCEGGDCNNPARYGANSGLGLGSLPNGDYAICNSCISGYIDTYQL